MSLLRLAFPRSLNLLTKNPISTTKINDICNNAFLKSSFVNSELNKRFFSLTSKHCCQEEPVKTGKYGKPGRNRTTKIPVETSIAYVTSEAFREAYGDKLVWEGYRRVHKGNIPPKKTRASCIRFNFVTTASPCPICRDEYLILDHRNLRLLKQFISEHTGEIIPYSKTGLCQKQHRNLVIALERAYDLGVLEYQVPFRQYDYSLYYENKEQE